jgi:hypothetical protein
MTQQDRRILKALVIFFGGMGLLSLVLKVLRNAGLLDVGEMGLAFGLGAFVFFALSLLVETNHAR